MHTQNKYCRQEAILASRDGFYAFSKHLSAQRDAIARGIAETVIAGRAISPMETQAYEFYAWAADFHVWGHGQRGFKYYHENKHKS